MLDPCVQDAQEVNVGKMHEVSTDETFQVGDGGCDTAGIGPWNSCQEDCGRSARRRRFGSPSVGLLRAHARVDRGRRTSEGGLQWAACTTLE